MKKNGVIASILFAIFLGFAVGNAQAQLSSVTIRTEHDISSSRDREAAYFDASSYLTPAIMTYVGNDGSVSVCAIDRNNRNILYVYEFTKDLVLGKTLRFQNPFNEFGAFTKDNEGNYYVFSAEMGTNRPNAINMALVKYDSAGSQKAVFN
jgi:hypothetical protein